MTICLSSEMYFQGLDFPIKSLFLVVGLVFFFFVSIDSDLVQEFPSPVESQNVLVLKHYCHLISSFMALLAST